MRLTPCTLALALALCALPPSTLATGGCGPQARIISVVGAGHVEAQPDVALLRFMVSATNPDPREARAAVEGAAGAFLKRLGGLGLPEGAVRAEGLTLLPRHESHDGRQVLVGYEASREVRVRLTDLGLIGQVTDHAMQSGINTIPGFSYDLQDRAALERRARELAVADALGKAQTLSQGLSVTLGKACRASFAQDPGLGRHGPMVMMNRAGGVPDVEAAYTPGTIALDASCEVEFPIE
ncbi:MAG: SIMPL domain-containing protein [Succinivibrionaceae bacterium]|nr:SIMPL domain-containing protein [Succinivibrionaceae bacterium]